MKKIKIPLLYLLSFVLSILPVGVYFIANADRYFVTLQDKIKLSAGLIMLVIIVFLKVIGKLKMPSRVVFFGMVFLMSYLLDSVLNDLMIFSFLALTGEIMDSVCQMFIAKAKENNQAVKTAKIAADEIEKVLNARV